MKCAIILGTRPELVTMSPVIRACEEQQRLDYLFAPTRTAKENLLREGIEKQNIFVTGNTIVDAVYQNILAKF